MIGLQSMVIALVLTVAAAAEAQVPLSEDAFRDLGGSKGIVILQVNWGRYWKCGRHENAQLQKIAFRRLNPTIDSSGEKDWVLSPFSTLLTKPSFEPYVVLLEPGKYAFSGFRLKIADSVSDIKVAEVGSSELIVDGKPVGGSFTSVAGEAIYIGHFGVDCKGEPTPWRFYVEGSQEFARYVDGFRKRYPFTKNVPVLFRLFETDQFGQPYELPK